MPSKLWGLIGLAMLSACSSNPQVADNRDYNAGRGSCEQLGFVVGTAGYDQCEENARIRTLVNQRFLTNQNNNVPVGMLVQQYNKPLSPLVNCTSYSVPMRDQPTLCD